MDVLFLSRIQFAFTVSFHYLFPPLSIGLSLMLIIMEGIYMKTKDLRYKKMAQFWTKVFALTFAMGVATGIVQVFAFGNNWASYSKFVGDVFGAALAAEGIFAFFLEAGFVGIMFFGWDRVKPSIHYLSTILVTVGAHFSATWICIANSWMQTPDGYKIVGEGSQARAVVTQFSKVLFNPSSIDRITHVLIGCWLTGAFMVLSVSAYYLLKKRHIDFAKICMKIGLIVAGITVFLQLISADSSARGVAKYQPEKLAAMEGTYKTEKNTPLTLIGWVNTKDEKVHGIRIPSLLSLLVYRNTTTPVLGLDQFDRKDWPNVGWVFSVYHIMIVMWGFMFLGVLLGCWAWWRKKMESSKFVLCFLWSSVLFPFIANQAGWFTAEMGRQPWIVYRILRTPQGLSKSVSASQVLGSLIMFIFIYGMLFSLYIFLMNRKLQHGPEDTTTEEAYSNPYKSIT